MMLLTVVFFLTMLTIATSDYQLRVRIHSYLNPESQCADCVRSLSNQVYGCCDNHTNTGECNGSEKCDTFFFFCLRSLGETEVGCSVDNQTSGLTAFFAPNTDSIVNLGDTVLGSENPITFSDTQPWLGLQFHLLSLDSNRLEGKKAQLIDAFAIDLSIEGGQRLEPQVYQGRFQIAEIELSFEVLCTDNLSLPNCSLCEPGSSEQCTDRRHIQANTSIPSNTASPCTPTGPGEVVVGGVMGAVSSAMLVCIGLLVLLLLKKRKQSTTTPLQSHESIKERGQRQVQDIAMQSNSAYEMSTNSLEAQETLTQEPLYEYID